MHAKNAFTRILHNFGQLFGILYWANADLFNQFSHHSLFTLFQALFIDEVCNFYTIISHIISDVKPLKL